VLVILIPTAWLAVVLFFVILCQMAARSDAALEHAPLRSGARVRRAGLEIFNGVPAPRLWRDAPIDHGPTRGGLMLHGRTGRRVIRARRPRCVS
jgi:hypothetical protein